MEVSGALTVQKKEGFYSVFTEGRLWHDTAFTTHTRTRIGTHPYNIFLGHQACAAPVTGWETERTSKGFAWDFKV